MLGAVPAAAMLYVVAPHVELAHFTGLFIAGVLMVGVFAVTWVFFVYRADRFIDLSDLVKSRLSRTQ